MILCPQIPWLLSAVIFMALPWLQEANKHKFELQPECRKSGNMRTMYDKFGFPKLYLYGGKGWRYRMCDPNGRGKGRGKGRHGKGKGGKGSKRGKGDYFCEHADPFSRMSKKQAKFGWKDLAFLQDTWVFDLVRGGWSVQDEPTIPPGRWKHETTTINANGAMVLFGGCDSTNASGVLADMWMLDAESGWKIVAEPPKLTFAEWNRTGAKAAWPRPRRGHIVVANDTHLVVFAGKTYVPCPTPGCNPDVVLNDLWALPLEALKPNSSVPLRWTQGASLPAPARWGSTGVVLTRADGSKIMAVFGGRNKNPWAAWHSTAADAYVYHNELWFYDFAKDKWELQQPEGPVPHKRDHHGAARVGGELIVYAGRIHEAKDASAVIGDVWAYSLETGRWRELGLEGDSQMDQAAFFRPEPRYMPAVAEVIWRGEEGIAVFGGETLPGSTKRTTLNDLWIYVPRRGAGWQKIDKSNCRFTLHDAEKFDDKDYTEEPEEDDAEELMAAVSPARLGERLADAAPVAEADEEDYSDDEVDDDDDEEEENDEEDEVEDELEDDESIFLAAGRPIASRALVLCVASIAAGGVLTMAYGLLGRRRRSSSEDFLLLHG
eukprot:TRINITY_DN16569_c0_g2_i3.p1 TRINITY_DN16569_c0_g2~~TRINITY_DN16569_c0_g2_i3.p1  ORF type:complete len:604 (-),score=146.65 TRINITY_DN16569_c0_g2_i3:112-1923(-)